MDQTTRNLARARLRVLIVDDHAVFRSRARAMLESSGCEVIGEADDAAGAIAKTRELGPDLVLLDVQLPDHDGFAVAAELAGEPNAPRIVLISSREAADYGSLLTNSPAAAFIHKPELSRSSLSRLIGATA